MDRRVFISALAALPFVGRTAYAQPRRAPTHPEPRPGITAANVLDPDKVDEEAREAFTMVREIPHIVDGIACPCGCSEREGNYSLLSCYEGQGMAQHCWTCRSCARLAHRLSKEGKTLADIRKAVDARY